MKETQRVNRREFLHRISLLGAAGASGSTLLAACGREEQSEQTAAGQSCDDVSGLTEQEIRAREVLQYVEQTPNPDERCDNCQFWLSPEGGAFCGGCQLFRGPVHPQGWCISWAPQMA
jgi:hypothetical protein